MTEKLALSDDILMKIEKPERYIGGEVNTVVKDAGRVKVRFAMCFPDVYEIGMSHLGIQILYHMINEMEDVWCERVYSPWLDLDAVMRAEKIPLFALESQDPVRDFDFLGITIQYEMCYTNILQILDLAGIPLLAADRGEDVPIVIGGGPCTYNPEPLADFFDLFYIGEGETQYRALFTLYESCREEGAGRVEFLRRAAKLPGIYVPRFYEASYHPDGTLKSFAPTEEGIPPVIRKEIVREMSPAFYPVKPIVPFIKITQDRVVLEIQRGCIRGCRFCQAGQVYRPVRERDVEVLKKYAVELLKNTGQEEISLSSLSSSDYSGLPELVDFLIEECSRQHTNISLPSLRIDAFSLDVMQKVQDVKKSSLTFAPEAGSQRLRDVINKGLTEEAILNGAALAFAGGWNRVKLYFMLGLPTETEEDIRGIAELANKIAAVYYDTVPKEKRQGGRVQIVASTSFFVPKPFTPFQWAAQCTSREFLEKAYQTRTAIGEQLNQKSIKYNWHEADASVMEGVLARGDRRLGEVIRRVYEKGSFYEAWGEYYKHDRWLETMEECGLSPDFYAFRERPGEELLPWDFIDCGVTKDFLLREWEKAKQAQPSENCKRSCQGCGAAGFGCGVCTEKRQEPAEGGTGNGIGESAVGESFNGGNVAPDSASPASGGTTPETAKEGAGEGVHESVKVRVKFKKYGPLRFIGHLDVMRFFQKAIRRAGIDVTYTAGFSPHQVMSFASPLGVGLESNGEYMDIQVNALPVDEDGAPSCAALARNLSRASVEGLDVVSAGILPRQSQNAMASVAAASYTVRFGSGREPALARSGEMEAALKSFLAREEIWVTKKGKRGERRVDIRPGIFEMTWQGDSFFLLLDASSGGNIKPVQVIEALLTEQGQSLGENALRITREELYVREKTQEGEALLPLDQMCLEGAAL